jgi:hypothetical protein
MISEESFIALSISDTFAPVSFARSITLICIVAIEILLSIDFLMNQSFLFKRSILSKPFGQYVSFAYSISCSIFSGISTKLFIIFS